MEFTAPFSHHLPSIFCYKWVDFPPRYEQIILFGRSVGSGPTVYLASRRGAPEMLRVGKSACDFG